MLALQFWARRHHIYAMQGLWRPWPWGEVEVEVELLEWRPPPLQALNVKLFEVPMAQQRYAFVLDVIRQHGAQTVVDLGCGCGKLLKYLLQQVMPETQSDTHCYTQKSPHVRNAPLSLGQKLIQK